MIDNRPLLESLLREGRVRLGRGRLLDRPPAPHDPRVDWDRVDGMLLGVAVGDALGGPTEGMLPGERRARYGEIRDYLPYRRSGSVATPTDDTQLTFWTLAQLLEDGGLVPERLAQRFAAGRIFGIGSAVAEALARVREGRPWHECGAASAGNGALMRVAPLLVPYVRSPSAGLWADVALAAVVTHNDPTSTSACLAFAAMLWDLLGMRRPPAPEWWWTRYAEVAADLEGETRLQPRHPAVGPYEGPLWRFVAGRLPDAFSRGLPVRDACDGWLSGAYLLETVPSVLCVLARHADDPEEAVVRAVNDTKDNDTVAAVVGAAVGALHGARSFPDRWLRGLTGRTAERDDGEVQRLLAAARARWDL